MKCFRCPKKSPETTLYRMNPKGEDGIWACKNHRGDKVDPELDEIVKALTQTESEAS